MKMYEPSPTDGRKSFYGKARVEVMDDGTETLFSFNTAVMRKMPDGKLVRLYDGWTQTTGRHIKAFCGLTKSEYDKMPVAAEGGNDNANYRAC